MIMSKSSLPYLSLVVTSRNDGDSHDAIARLQLFVDSLLAQMQRYELNSELILVEWNPPADRARLHELVSWPQDLGYCRVRIIEAPTETHSRFQNSDVIFLFQMVAKNVGIRRARGRFVLATNIDILFSNELVKFLASKRLWKNRMYRIDRYDVPGNAPTDVPIDEQMSWCQHNVIRLYRHLQTVEIKDGVIPLRRKKWKKLRKRIGEWFLQWFSRDEPVLHTNACGDFTLLSKKHWERVSGYPEFPMRAMKLDGLLCYAAYYTGAKEITLNDPMRIYHLDHSGRSDGAIVALSERGSGGASYQVSPHQYKAWVEEMRMSRRPIIFNKDRWGLSNEELPEIVIGR